MPIETKPEPTAAQQRLFSVQDAVGYLRSIGAAGATANFVRQLINSGTVPHLKIGRAFYVSRTALDSWLERNQHRAKG